jgi:hypothetical protein
LAVTVVPVVADKPVDGLQIYVDAPDAVRLVLVLIHIVGFEGEIWTAGVGLTVTTKSFGVPLQLMPPPVFTGVTVTVDVIALVPELVEVNVNEDPSWTDPELGNPIAGLELVHVYEVAFCPVKDTVVVEPLHTFKLLKPFIVSTEGAALMVKVAGAVVEAWQVPFVNTTRNCQVFWLIVGINVRKEVYTPWSEPVELKVVDPKFTVFHPVPSLYCQYAPIVLCWPTAAALKVTDVFPPSQAAVETGVPCVGCGEMVLPTVKVEAVLVTVQPFENIALYWYPFWLFPVWNDKVLLLPSFQVNPLFPPPLVRLLQVLPPSVLCCHMTVGTGDPPVPLAIIFTVAPLQLAASESVWMVGAMETETVVEVEVLWHPLAVTIKE